MNRLSECVPVPTFERFIMEDRLRPDEVVDIVRLEGPLDAIERAVHQCTNNNGAANAHATEKEAEAKTEVETKVETKADAHPTVPAGREGVVRGDAVDGRAEEETEERTIGVARRARIPRRATGVLVHCDMGHNRSPTLVLLTLLRRGLTLREAYRTVLRVRPSIGEYNDKYISKAAHASHDSGRLGSAPRPITSPTTYLPPPPPTRSVTLLP